MKSVDLTNNVNLAMRHTLTLKSTNRVDAKRRESKFDASCSCGMWHARNVIRSDARESYDRHVAAAMGPDTHQEAK